VSPALRDARPLVADGDFAVTLQSVTTRRFSNTIRVIATARLTNRGRFPLHSGALTLRLLSGDEISAPVRDPNAVIQPNAAVSGEYVLEAPPTTIRVVLRGTVGNETAEVPFDIR
jgi:hypothetical protein